MKTTTLSIDYRLKWCFKDAEYICISDDKNRTVINTKTNRIIKQSLNGYSIGFWIERKFIPLAKVNERIRKIEPEYVPF